MKFLHSLPPDILFTPLFLYSLIFIFIQPNPTAIHYTLHTIDSLSEKLIPSALPSRFILFFLLFSSIVYSVNCTVSRSARFFLHHVYGECTEFFSICMQYILFILYSWRFLSFIYSPFYIPVTIQTQYLLCFAFETTFVSLKLLDKSQTLTSLAQNYFGIPSSDSSSLDLTILLPLQQSFQPTDLKHSPFKLLQCLDFADLLHTNNLIAMAEEVPVTKYNLLVEEDTK